MKAFVDNLDEDDVERERLPAKPTCFIIFGKPGVGKSTLAKKMAETWNCILVDDTYLINTHIRNKTKEGRELLSILSEGETIQEDVVLQLILDKINSPNVEHYGYVLSCLPFISEDSLKICQQIELIQNLKLTPDFIINIKCEDKDLIQRLSGLRQNPESGQLYNSDQWKQEDVCSRNEIMDDDEGQDEEEDLSKDTIDQNVWIPEYLPRNAFTRINMYKDYLLRPLEDYISEHNPLYILQLDGNSTIEELHMSVMARLETMAIKRVSVPVLLSHYAKELPDIVDTEYLLKYMSSIRNVAPCFQWKRSRWGRACPVALKEGNIFAGKHEFSVGFQDKLYILSSEEAYCKFVENPCRYLIPPMPRPPCKVSIIGPPLAGKSTICSLLAQHYGAVVLNIEELSQPLLAKAEEERIEKIKEETKQTAIEKINMKMELDGEKHLVTEDHPEVKTLVLHAVEEAKKMAPFPFQIYADVLQNHLQEIEGMDSTAEAITGWVLDNFPKNHSEMAVLEKAAILPDLIICLVDSSGHQVLKRVYEKKEKVNEAIKQRLKDELSQKNENGTNEKESDRETVVEGKDESPALWEDSYCGSSNITEMKEYKEQMQLFEREWAQMQSSLTVNHFNLEVGSKSPEDLLQEIIQKMEKPFQYVARQISMHDLEEAEGDTEALVALETAEKDSSDNETESEEDESESTIKRPLGDTKHFCPVALKNNNVLWPSKDKISAKYRERIYYFSTIEARESFLQNPAQFVARKEPLQPPALRIFLLGARGSGKSTHGEWLAQKLGLFHIQFREKLQMQIIAKTGAPVPREDEVLWLNHDLEYLETLIKDETVGERDVELNSGNINKIEEAMTEEELAIKAYLSHGKTLSPPILDTIILPYFKEEPYMSTGFILEGFPSDPKHVKYMLERQLFPDVVVVLEVEVEDVEQRLLPAYINKWHNLHIKQEEQLKLLRHLRSVNREEKISKRRAELLQEHGPKQSSFTVKKDHEEDKDFSDIGDEIEAILKVEFPEEDDIVGVKNEETENDANERIKKELKDRFEKDVANLATVTELLSENEISKLPFNASQKLRIIQYDLFQKINPLLVNRESLFQTSQPISYKLAQKLLISSYKLHSAFGCWDPVQQYKEKDMIQLVQWPLKNTYALLFNQYIYFFGSKENRNLFMLNPLKYLRQPKPTPSLPIKIAVAGPPKSGKTTVAQMFAEKYGLARLSIGEAMRMVLNHREHSHLALQMRRYLNQGLVLPDELAIQCLEVMLLRSVCSIQGYVLDGFPATLQQAKLMESRSIIPMIVFELNIDTMEVLRRGCVDKMNPSRPYLKLDSPTILHSWDSSYQKEIRHVRQFFQEQHQNWLVIGGLKNKWWIWNNILKEVNISMKCMNSYLDRAQSGKAACLSRLCITPKELNCHLGEFGHYCPVCLAVLHHLVDCSETAALTHAAEYKRKYYRLCGDSHLQAFLSTPDEFLAPCCPHDLPQPHLLPRKLTEFQMKNKFPQQAEIKGFCPVTYIDGKQRYEALVQGKLEYAVEYRGRLYIFETKQKQDKFLRMPETYWDQKLPCKVPPLCEPVSLTSLPTLGYLEQGAAVPLIKAMTAVGSLKPKFPFVSIQRSALLYVAFYLKAFNPNGTNSTRQKYKKKLASFEENNELIPYLSLVMRGGYKPPSERPVDFDFKLNRFLALKAQGSNGAL